MKKIEKLNKFTVIYSIILAAAIVITVVVAVKTAINLHQRQENVAIEEIDGISLDTFPLYISENEHMSLEGENMLNLQYGEKKGGKYTYKVVGWLIHTKDNTEMNAYDTEKCEALDLTEVEEGDTQDNKESKVMQCNIPQGAMSSKLEKLNLNGQYSDMINEDGTELKRTLYGEVYIDTVFDVSETKTNKIIGTYYTYDGVKNAVAWDGPTKELLKKYYNIPYPYEHTATYTLENGGKGDEQ